MTWLLTIILISAIIGWVNASSYADKMDELRKKHDKEIEEYQDQLRLVMNDLLETKHELKKYIGR